MGKELTANHEVLHLDKDYLSFLNTIKERFTKTQFRVVSAVNTALLNFYWELGNDILTAQKRKQQWGTKFLEQLSHDLQISNPGMKGFSKRNLEYMRLLVITYPEKEQFTQQPAAQLP